MSKLKIGEVYLFLLWVVITITMIVTMPNMDKLVKRKKGTLRFLIQNKVVLLTK